MVLGSAESQPYARHGSWVGWEPTLRFVWVNCRLILLPDDLCLVVDSVNARFEPQLSLDTVEFFE